MSDVPKPGCPWCGSASSVVYDSRGDLRAAVYRRQRQCLDCAQCWPTVEVLDRERFERELARIGRTLADLGLGDE